MSAPRSLVLSGASRGLGRALLERWLAAGHRVAACSRTRPQDLPTAEGLLYQELDVADEAAVQAFAAKALEAHGAPDLVLANAALVNDPAPLWQVPAAEFERLISVNVGGVAALARAFLPAMIQAGQGVFVGMSSGWGRSTSPEVAPYCASKFAVEGLCAALAQELPPGLAAVALNPGIIDTAMLRRCWGGSAAAYEGPRSWAERADPFLLGLGPGDSGRALSVP